MAHFQSWIDVLSAELFRLCKRILYQWLAYGQIHRYLLKVLVQVLLAVLLFLSFLVIPDQIIFAFDLEKFQSFGRQILMRDILLFSERLNLWQEFPDLVVLLFDVYESEFVPFLLLLLAEQKRVQVDDSIFTLPPVLLSIGLNFLDLFDLLLHFLVTIDTKSHSRLGF